MPLERRTILFSGRVQGVGFRQSARELAEDLAVGGTVRNLPDGRVELVVDGSAADIEKLIKLLREHFGGLIRKVEQDQGIAQGFQRAAFRSLIEASEHL